MPDIVIRAWKLRESVTALRVEFLRSRARAHRFREEVLMILEEQRRVLVSLENDAVIWDRRQAASTTFPDKSPVTVAGLAAYAAEQADLKRRMKEHFRKLWTGDKDVLKILEDDAPEAEMTGASAAKIPYIYVHDDSDDECVGHGLGEDSDDE